MTARAFTIVNLEAGGGKTGRLFHEFLGELARGGLQVDLHVTREAGEATAAAREAVARYEQIIAAGGDGTINEVLNGIAGSGLTLGILPMGTQNVLANEFGIPERPRDAARVILESHVSTIDLGCANGRYFALMAGIGFDAYVTSNVRRDLKKLFGGAAYVLAALEQALSYDPEPISVEVDGRPQGTGYFVVVGNARHYTRFFEFSPQSDMADGLLDISVFRNRDLLQLVKVAVTAQVVPPGRFPDVDSFQGSTIRLTAPKEVLAHVDAEILGVTPIEITTAPRALRFYTPANVPEKKKGRTGSVNRAAPDQLAGGPPTGV